MNRNFKMVALIAVLVIGVFALTACGSKEESKKIEISNKASAEVEYIKLVSAEKPDDAVDFASEIKDGESSTCEFEGEDESYLLQVKFKDNDFVYTSQEVSFEELTKIELSAKDGKIILDVYHGDEKENVFLEQPAAEKEEKAPVEPQVETQQSEPVTGQEYTEPSSPQPSEPADAPAQSEPKKDGCLNDALFN